MSLELKLYSASRNGKMRPDFFRYEDVRFRKDWTPGISQFILDQEVRYMCICKHEIEKLRSFPVFVVDDEDVTKEYLPEYIKEMEKIFGKFEYATERTKREKGVIKYLQEMGVEVCTD